MSIVNDALKKVGKEFKSNGQEGTQIILTKEPIASPDKKWTVIITMALVVIALFSAL